MVYSFMLKTAAVVSAVLASIGAASAELKTVKLSHPYGSSAEVFLFGAHLKSFRAAMDPKMDVLFMSNDSYLDGVNPIRGGIPVVFPNFGGAPGFPNHGFARITNWTLAGVTEAADKNSPSVAKFTMAASNSTRSMWPVEFELEYEVKLSRYPLSGQTSGLRSIPVSTDDPRWSDGIFDDDRHFESDAVGSSLSRSQLSDSRGSFDLSSSGGASHNYLWVDDSRNEGVVVSGLKGVDYFDQVAKVNKTETREYISFGNATQQTGNTYLNAPDQVVATIKGINTKDRTVTVQKNGFISGDDAVVKTQTDAVVWNPGAERAKKLEDFGDEEYINMVCIEPGRVSVKQQLPAGQTFTLQQNITVTSF
ncbi:unnamed protein product [Phytophthora lilii]|uniref:glucose-6-phosphate 1-epimerase n=1 Tax=Phytophthora lilii TaxID=2077276 RepID=A0A9W6U077_9STRA|nr:unnamed protein product [Phytophthora lilii]